MADTRPTLLSNKVITVIALILAAGILLDGKLYNHTPDTTGIYSLPNPRSITISRDDQLIMTFTQQNSQWELMHPAKAPLNAERIQVVLDTNTQTIRSYDASEMPIEELFAHALVVNIDNKVFHLGELEPVSKQRYVLANERVYLQSNHVMPMLNAGVSAFLDLQITDAVVAVEIESLPFSDPDSWSSLMALGIVPRSALTTGPVTMILVKQKNRPDTALQLHIEDEMAILASPLKPYGYLISQQQATQLGLAQYK